MTYIYFYDGKIYTSSRQLLKELHISTKTMYQLIVDGKIKRTKKPPLTKKQKNRKYYLKTAKKRSEEYKKITNTLKIKKA